MLEYSCFNGQIVRYQDLCIHVSDLGLQRGYGVFDFFGVVESQIKWKNDYFNRFYHSADAACLDIQHSRAELEKMIQELISLNRSPNSFFKLIATGGYSPDGYTFIGETNFLILNLPPKIINVEDYEKGVALIRQEFLRPNPEIKSLNYLMSAMLQKKMAEYKAIDVLYLYNDFVYETSRANVFMIKNGKMATPAKGILHGITRKHIISEYSSQIEIQERNITFEELLEADELFITSTTKFIMPVVRIENFRIGDGKVGKICKELISDFNKP